MELRAPGSPTNVRYLVLAVATANAFLLYLDRLCMTATVQSDSFQREMGLDSQQVGSVLSAFFLAYALGQLPAGFLADRFGPRRMLAVYILLWSLCTALTGSVAGLATLLIVRLACGLAEAGAYPASARLITRWFPFAQRARANSVVAFGGRVGNALALWVTALFIVSLGSWRPVLQIYGAIGLLLSALTWTVFRNRPDEHPWANEEERALIDSPPPSTQPPFPWASLLAHRSLWLLSLGGLGMNLGWAFLITWMPSYLTEVRGVDKVTAGQDVTIALGCGLAGMLFGGWWCDFLTRRFGVRWGRRLPFLTGGALAATAYLLCPLLPTAAVVAVACAVVAFAADSMVPATWALAQDIGGEFVAATLAWCNMWGNLGASLIAKLIPTVRASHYRFADWREIFWLCAGGFVLLGVCICFVDGEQKLQAVPDRYAGSDDAAGEP
jgi:ACS family glucarate transporter-like MFS transporter